MFKVALAGNPNSGKTTLFNGLTGSTAHVGNWPGVTVDKREGLYKKSKEAVYVIDLPGIYSLSPYTQEEVIARKYILDEQPDCVINIVDATNIERNLYLTTQILEIDVPVVVALNMIDEVEKQGDSINEQILSEKLGVPVVKISALKGEGFSALMQKVLEECGKKREGATVLTQTKLGALIAKTKQTLQENEVDNPLFHAVKLIEDDEKEVEAHASIAKTIAQYKTEFDENTDFEAIVADERYQYVTMSCLEAVTYRNADRFRLSSSDKADKVLTHKIWGIPIFLVILFAIFHLTFSEDFLYLGAIFSLPTLEELGYDVESYGVRWLATLYDGAIMSPGVTINNVWNDMLVGELFGLIQGGIESTNMAAWAVGLINNGIIDGLASVLSFLPPVLTLFLFFAILEDTGYMARIAFILDKLFRRFGLSGRAFMPLIMGFGCSVPAMLNTRTLADDKERTATVRVIPFFSCGAKLPILTAVAGGIVSYFGIGNAELITYGMYLLGITVAILSVLLMRNTTLKGETPPFIMELPAYHMPQAKSLALHLWDKAKHFIKKAFTIILASTVVIWIFTHFSFDWKLLSDERINESILAGVSKLIQPLFTPLGFGSQLGSYGWVFAVAIIAGLIAKENVISTFSTLAACLIAVANMQFGVDVWEESGVGAVQAMIMATGISVPALISFIAFNMTTIPCFAAIGTAKSELSGKTFGFTLLFWLATSYIVGAVIYTVGIAWWSLFLWLAAAGAITAGVVLWNKFKPQKKERKEKQKKKHFSCSCCSQCGGECAESKQNDHIS